MSIVQYSLSKVAGPYGGEKIDDRLIQSIKRMSTFNKKKIQNLLLKG
jgi:hypothetical protein